MISTNISEIKKEEMKFIYPKDKEMIMVVPYIGGTFIPSKNAILLEIRVK